MKPIIDISFWQTPQQINYDLLAKQIDGVIIRAAYGTSKDIHFDRHYREFITRGVLVGAYHYLIGSASPADQAKAFLEFTAQKELRLGRWMDIEATGSGTRLHRNQVLEYAALMPADVGVYTSHSKWQEIMGGAYLTGRKLWVAYYTTTALKPLLPVGFDYYWLWQYTKTGRLPGYSGNLDLNRFGGTEAEFAAWIGGEAEPPAPEPEPPVDVEPLYKAVVKNIAPDRLNVRNKPNGKIIGKLHTGDKVEVWQEQSGWCRIGVDRWVSGQYLQKLAETPEPPPPPELELPTPEPPGIWKWLLKVKLWSQHDPRWANDRMGYTSIKLGQQGCLVTATAIYLDYLGVDIDPKLYNHLLSTRGGYESYKKDGKIIYTNNMYWKYPGVLFPDKIEKELTDYRWYWNGKGWETQAHNILQSKRPVLALVDLYPGGGLDQHWVVIVGYRTEDGWWAVDPDTGTLINLSKYNNKVYRIVAYGRKL